MLLMQCKKLKKKNAEIILLFKVAVVCDSMGGDEKPFVARLINCNITILNKNTGLIRKFEFYYAFAAKNRGGE